jgi:hypothetical protein
MELLKNSTLEKLDVQRPESSSILQGVQKTVPTIMLSTYGKNHDRSGVMVPSFEQA